MIVVDPKDMPPEHWRPGVETRMLVSASIGATQLCIFEQWIAPGTGAPTHFHPVEEVLTVREGEAEMWLDQERIIVTAGRHDQRLAGGDDDALLIEPHLGFAFAHGQHLLNGMKMGRRAGPGRDPLFEDA